MRTYKHLRLWEREKIYAWKLVGLSLREIAKKLGRSHTTLSRELHRNAKYERPYLPIRAEKLSLRRGERQRRKAPLKSPLIYLYVRKHLRLFWTPEEIAGRLGKDYPGSSIDDETIYRYVYRRNVLKNKYYQYLAQRRLRRRKNIGRKVPKLSKIPNAVAIDLRPKVANRRIKPGHWETDNMEGLRTDKTVVSVTTERVTRFTRLGWLINKTSMVKITAVAKQLTPFPKIFKQTITTDNGAENTYHGELTKITNIPVYFCHPYHSWEKGTVENTIGRIRRFIPKGTSLNDYSPEYLYAVECWVNNTPRKCLDYLTPYEKMRQLLDREIKKKELTI